MPNRFEWLKAVLQSDAMNGTAKLVASAMAVQFANDETGQLNPSVKTLAEYLKVSQDTVKRAVRALVKDGWLGRTEGRGRGNKTAYRLASPGKIIALSRSEKGANLHRLKGGNAAPLSEKKGANLLGKGGNAAPSYIEQSLEQNAQARVRFAKTRFTGNPYDGPVPIKITDWEALNPWADWLENRGLPKLCQLNVSEKSGSGKEYLFLPFRSPPDDPIKVQEALTFFKAMMAPNEVRYAAQ